jgi:predicted RNase H-like HicB family nuclease
MKYYSFQIVIEINPNGKTIEDAKRNIREAIKLHLESVREN